MNLSFLNLIRASLLASALSGCATPPVQVQPLSPKINMQLADLSPDGLRGKSSSDFVAVSYEFCIPTDEKIQQSMKQIDRTLEFFPRANGRIGCGAKKTLSIGNTYQPNWRGVLNQLAASEHVKEIRDSHGE